MNGGMRRPGKRRPQKTYRKTHITDPHPPCDAQEPTATACKDLTTENSLGPCTSTPKRRKRWTADAGLASTPVHNSSTNIVSNVSSSPFAKHKVHLNFIEVITKTQTSEGDSEKPSAKTIKRKRERISPTPRQLRQRVSKEQPHTNGVTIQRKCVRTQKIRNANSVTGVKLLTSRCRRRRLEQPAPNEQQEKDECLSSDLSIELSPEKPRLPTVFTQEEKDSDEEEEELPSFLTQVDKKSLAITEGTFAWGKCRNYPFWPALVKSVNRKQKRASIVFVDDWSIQQKKGFAVALRSLKPFNCEEADELINKAKENYKSSISWSLALIEDYRIRKACGSFSGSFIEYLNHDMSYPVRRMFPQAAAEGPIMFGSDSMLEESFDNPNNGSPEKEDEETHGSSKRLLPDRSHAAHNRANEKLVHFIVKQRMVEGHLMAVICGQQQSKWLHTFFHSKRRRVVNIYLEDDQQLDQVYFYLNELYAKAVASPDCLAELKSADRVPFVLDVLLPEAIIYAIAGVNNVSVKKAKEKYLKGRCISNRERQEFDVKIEQQMRRKSRNELLSP